MPVNDGNGLNVTTPVVGSTVYVPSPGTVNDVLSHEFGFCTGSMPHNFTVVATRGTPALACVVNAQALIAPWYVPGLAPVEPFKSGAKHKLIDNFEPWKTWTDLTAPQVKSCLLPAPLVNKDTHLRVQLRAYCFANIAIRCVRCLAAMARDSKAPASASG